MIDGFALTAFAMPSSSAGLTLNSGTTLRRLVASAKASNKGTKIVLSVGPSSCFIQQGTLVRC